MGTILVAIDGSKCSLRALRAAVERAQESPGTLLHLLAVYRSPQPVNAAKPAPARDKQVTAEDAEAVLRQAEAQLPSAYIRRVCETIEGAAAEVIVRRAAELECEVIFMGADGLGRVDGRDIGSVAASVIELTELPVRLVK